MIITEDEFAPEPQSGPLTGTLTSYPSPMFESEREFFLFAEPSEEFQAEAFDYICRTSRASRTFVQKKVPAWREALAIYMQEVTLQELREGTASLPQEANDTSRISISALNTVNDDEELWQSQFVFPVGSIAEKWGTNAWGQIFDGPDFLTVLADEQPNSQSPAEIQWAREAATPEEGSVQFPLLQRLQKYIVSLFRKGKIHARMMEVLTLLCLFGFVYAKIRWDSIEITKWKLEPYTGKPIPVPDVVMEAVICQPIDPAMLLVDPLAMDDDLQRWRFIGHRTRKAYQECLAGFDTGRYTLNREEFERRFENSGGIERAASEDSLFLDYHTLTDTDEEALVELWEWHGKVPSKSLGGLIECCGIIATDVGAEDPMSGILIKLTTYPVNCTGLRPFASAQFSQHPGPFGIGILDRYGSVHMDLSQSVAQFVDGMRFACNPICALPEDNAAAWQQLEEEGGCIKPGMVLKEYEANKGLRAVQLPDFRPDILIQHITMMKAWLEEGTMTQTAQGFAGSTEQTATEAQILLQQSTRPIQTKVQIFAENFLTAMGEIALGWIQQSVLTDRTVYMQDAISGEEIPQIITAEEIQNGKYRVVPTLSRQDAMRMARAQSIERMIKTLVEIEPRLVQENVKVVFYELLRRMIDLWGIDGAERIVVKMGSEEMMLRQQIQDLQMQIDQLMNQQGPPPKQNNQDMTAPPPEPPRFPEEGGPMGPIPTDPNILADILKEQQREQIQPWSVE